MDCEDDVGEAELTGFTGKSLEFLAPYLLWSIEEEFELLLWLLPVCLLLELW